MTCSTSSRKYQQQQWCEHSSSRWRRRDFSTRGCNLQDDVYIDSGNNKKALHLLSIGLTADNNDNEPLFLFDRAPWSVLAKISDMHPWTTDYVNEIVRRANLYHIALLPRPSNWTREQTMEWPERNPVRDLADIDFLRNKVARLRNVLDRKSKKWTGHAGWGRWKLKWQCWRQCWRKKG
jgi:hypothetical protein